MLMLLYLSFISGGRHPALSKSSAIERPLDRSRQFTLERTVLRISPVIHPLWLAEILHRKLPLVDSFETPWIFQMTITSFFSPFAFAMRAMDILSCHLCIVIPFTMVGQGLPKTSGFVEIPNVLFPFSSLGNLSFHDLTVSPLTSPCRFTIDLHLLDIVSLLSPIQPSIRCLEFGNF